MQEFTYHGLQRLRVIIGQLTGVLAIMFFTGFAGFLLYAMTEIPTDRTDIGLLEDPKVTLVCLVFYFTILAWVLGLTFINFLPTVWVSNEGLMISAFFIFRILIRWEDIIDVSAGRVPVGYVLVRTRRITPLHRIYGWLYSRSLYPSFIIGRGIEDREKLIREIQGKTKSIDLY
jgi:hypothetical protein